MSVMSRDTYAKIKKKERYPVMTQINTSKANMDTWYKGKP